MDVVVSSEMARQIPLDEEPRTDHGKFSSACLVGDDDIESHRTRSIFTGISPEQFRHRRSKKAAAPQRKRSDALQPIRHLPVFDEPGASATPPQERVQFLLGGSELKANGHSAAPSTVNMSDATDVNGGNKKDTHEDVVPGPTARHDVFCEMAELSCDSQGEYSWKECARWVKFEEDVEEGGERWSKPHVAALSLHSLLELRCCFVNPITVVMLDADVQSLDQLADMMVEKYSSLVVDSGNAIDRSISDRLRELLLARKMHLYSMRKAHGKDNPLARSFAEISHRLGSSVREMPHEVAHRGERDTEPTGDEHTASPKKCGSTASIARNDYGRTSVSTGPHAHSQSSAAIARRSSHDSLPDKKDTPTGTAMGSRKTSVVGSATLLGADDDTTHASAVKFDTHFMKKIPPGAEAANILVGELDVEKPLAAFVRLSHARLFPEMTEVPLPTRYIFVLLAPRTHGTASKHREIGRSIATLMADEVFHEVAFKARNRDDLLAGIDEFLSNVTVLPPGEWDPTIRIEPPQSVPSQQPRKEGAVLVLQSQAQAGGDGTGPGGSDGDQPHAHELDDSLRRTGRLFGGLVVDIKRKIPSYASDFRDGVHVQSLAAFVFLYFACLAPTITFGGMLNKYLDGYMATMESILSAALCGVVFSLLAGQPLTILGSTGPVLVFESIIYQLSKIADFDFMSGRLWIGMWCFVMLLLIVAFDMSSLVRYITRFTEESFSCLIALIFIVESFKQLNEVRKEYPVVGNPQAMYAQYYNMSFQCACVEYLDPLPLNRTYDENLVNELLANTSTNSAFQIYPIELKVRSTALPLELQSLVCATNNWTTFNDSSWLELKTVTIGQCSEDKQRKPIGSDCHIVDYVPDVFFFSSLLFLGTFFISFGLKELKTSRFFSAKVRVLISDFAVVIAIILMSLVDFLVGLHTPKLEVPMSFQPTRPGRGWLISPFTARTPVWVMFGSILPALLVTILVFMDQQITAVIINRKENKMQKGVGYHLDLLVLAVLVLVCSFLGLPWFVASTVPSINHVMALRKESKCTAPGEKPTYLGCRENRLTGLAIAIMTALSVFLGFVLKHIPMPVLFGVFLFMGISCLNGIELVTRFLIMLMPSKNQPDYMFLRNVRLSRVHLFTLIQLISIAVMWAIKEISITSIAFPLLVLAMCFIRKGLDKVFEQKELFYLDDIIPEAHKREQEDAAKKHNTNSNPSELPGNAGRLEVPLENGRVVSIAVDSVKFDKDARKFNISEQVRRTSIWRSLMSDSQSHLSATNIAASALAANDEPMSRVRKRTVDRDSSVTTGASFTQPLIKTADSPRGKKPLHKLPSNGDIEMPEIVVMQSSPESKPKIAKR